MISINKLTKKFGKNTAVDEFSYNFDSKIYGLLGPNGSGKTTLMRCMANLYKYSGSIEFDSKSIKGNKDYLNNIGYLSQNFGMFPQLTVREMLTYIALSKDMKRSEVPDSIEKYLEAVSLTDKADAKISSLSGGMVRRIGVAQALLGEPQLILFDEPTVGLDPEERIRFKNTVKQQKTENNTIILSTHIVSDVADICDKIIIVDKGKIKFSGTCEEAAAKAKGKVYLITQDQQCNLTIEFSIQGQQKKDGEDYVRILTSSEADGISVEPTLEDGYICCIKNI